MKESLLFILKSLSFGLLIILVSFIASGFLIAKYASPSHAHAMTGLFNIVIGLGTAGIFAVLTIVLALFQKTNLRKALITATAMSFFGVLLALLLEM